MTHIYRVLVLFAVCGWFGATKAIAQANDPQQNRLDEATKDLTSKKFALRQAAFQTLVRNGEAAIAALEKEASTDNLEAGTRCLEALVQIAREKQNLDAALAALDRLAADPSSRIANLAIIEAKKLRMTDEDRAIARLAAAGVRVRRDSRGELSSISIEGDRHIGLLQHLPNLRSASLSGLNAATISKEGHQRFQRVHPTVHVLLK